VRGTSYEIHSAGSTATSAGRSAHYRGWMRCVKGYFPIRSGKIASAAAPTDPDRRRPGKAAAAAAAFIYGMMGKKKIFTGNQRPMMGSGLIFR